MDIEMNYNREEVIKQLKELGTERMKATAKKRGAGDNQYGVGLTKLRGLAKKIKKNHELALDLWRTGNTDAMLLATMIMDEKRLSEVEIVAMISDISYYVLLDELFYNVVVKCSFADEFAKRWMDSSIELIGRAGWDIITYRLIKEKPIPVTYDELLNNMRQNIKAAPMRKQEVMYRCLSELSKRFSKYTDLCLLIGEQLGELNKPVLKDTVSTSK